MSGIIGTVALVEIEEREHREGAPLFLSHSRLNFIHCSSISFLSFSISPITMIWKLEREHVPVRCHSMGFVAGCANTVVRFVCESGRGGGNMV